jgi:hypothetical protein
MPVIPGIQEAKVRGSWSKGGLGKSMRSYLKNNVKAKSVGDLAPVSDYLPSKHKPLSSSPSTTKEK